jgi:hypothetical protein
VLYPTTLPSGFAGILFQLSYPGQTIGTINSNSGTAPVHAALWTSAGTVDLNPTNLFGITTSQIEGGNGVQQVGYASGLGTGSNNHAILWNGTAASAIDLNPTNLSGLSQSIALGTDGIHPVGSASGNATANYDHAILWNGSASSAVDLQPANLGIRADSQAYGVVEGQEVGYGIGSATGFSDHAFLWGGSASTAMDLGPTKLGGITDSIAFATDGVNQVGEGWQGTNDNYQALLWTGSADSAVNLNPTDLGGTGTWISQAVGISGTQEVGTGISPSGSEHALLWNGSAASAVDLQTFLPSTGTWTYSFCNSIDANGNVYGIADGTIDGQSGIFGVEWSPIPEPTTGSAILVAAAMSVMRRQSRETRLGAQLFCKLTAS